MEMIKQAILSWLREILVSGTMESLSGLFDAVNQNVGQIAQQVGTTPEAWQPDIFSMVRRLSDSVCLPIAGTVLAFVMTLELIEMVTERNNMHGDADTWMFFRWIFRAAASILIVSNTWDIVMAIFDVAQHLVTSAAGLITGSPQLSAASAMDGLEERLGAMEVGPLFGIWFEALLVRFTVQILALCIFVVLDGRMMEIYLATSVAPIPMATMLSHHTGGMGANYLRSMFALGLQAFMIIVCVAIYAALVGGLAVSDNLSAALWTCLGYTVLLCFALLKTGSLSRSVLAAH